MVVVVATWAGAGTTVMGLTIVLHIVVVMCCGIAAIVTVICVGVMMRVGAIAGVDVRTIAVVVVARSRRTMIVVNRCRYGRHEVCCATLTPAELNRLEVVERGERVELIADAVVRHNHIIIVAVNSIGGNTHHYSLDFAGTDTDVVPCVVRAVVGFKIDIEISSVAFITDVLYIVV